jgi:hypothetical protein
MADIAARIPLRVMTVFGHFPISSIHDLNSNNPNASCSELCSVSREYVGLWSSGVRLT